MDNPDFSRAAVDGFKEGYNCAESLIAAFNRFFGDKEINIALATPFGAGLGARRDLCGILTAGTMIIGNYYGRRDPGDIEQKTKAYNLAGSYYRWFEKQFGALQCRDIVTGEFTGHTDACERIMREAAVQLGRMIGKE